ncbi:DUF2975 domain-containing protein [Desnuesiella massiliensis]|uniref:DUF2975 domain-containing protein n=1 Tax=Desnuesiella massiliensis TaxID=1650662 RepID=UPI0006E1C0D4|nr:DUF2975 domain-containing protein [Desnuesiella massiliensis]
MKDRISSKVLNGFVMLGIVLTILALIGTPLILTALLKVSRMELSVPNMEWILTGCIYACAIPYVVALFKLKSICGLLVGENSFSPKIAKEFKIIAICSFSEVLIFIFSELLLYFVYDFFLYAGTIIPMIVIPFIAVTAGFLSLVMSNIFKKAAEIKEEIDLTF